MRKLELKQYFSGMIDSPVGGLKLVASDAGLAAILWENDNPRRGKLTGFAGGLDTKARLLAWRAASRICSRLARLRERCPGANGSDSSMERPATEGLR